jgi:3-hydroxybutyryl-CoA dehydratase
MLPFMLHRALMRRSSMGGAVAVAVLTAPALRQAHSLAIGAIYSVDRTFDAAAVDAFTELTGDTNPIHTAAASGPAADHASAAAPAAQPPPIVPGMLLASLFPAIIGSQFSGALYLTQTLAFRSQCAVDEPVHAHVTVTHASGGRVRFATACHAASDGRVLVDGTALALIGGRPRAVEG